MIRPQRIVHDVKPGSLLKRTGAADQPQQPRSTHGDADRNYLILVSARDATNAYFLEVANQNRVTLYAA